MKVLFINSVNLTGLFGGAKASKRNLECLKHIFGSVDVLCTNTLDNNSLYGKCMTVFSKLFYSTINKRDVWKRVNSSDYDIIFLDNSLLGYLAKELRKNGYTGYIVVFFHNCEYDFYNSHHHKLRVWQDKLNRLYIKRNELFSLIYSDSCVYINARDQKRIHDLYGISATKEVICNMTLPDTFKNDSKVLLENNDIPLYTFIGSYFEANVNGIVWFIKNVFPYVTIRLRVVGKDMHRLNEVCDISMIEIYSNVPDLTKYMNESDYMIFPIFEGSGMKVKTCESLMYGKNIIGTPEAFSGYEIEDVNKIGACCKTAEEFISVINTISLPRFNLNSRQLYLKKYSEDVSIRIYTELFKDLVNT